MVTIMEFITKHNHHDYSFLFPEERIVMWCETCDEVVSEHKDNATRKPKDSIKD